jgi:hypothetical protein
LLDDQVKTKFTAFLSTNENWMKGRPVNFSTNLILMQSVKSGTYRLTTGSGDGDEAGEEN